MFKRLLLLAAVVFSVSESKSQTPVWSTDVAPILYNNCASCHRQGGIAPFSLLTYVDATSHGAAMSAAVSNRIMPPWPPNPNYKNLAHERLLSQQQIDKIVNWVSGSMPQGDPNLAPPIPTFSNNGDLIGTPNKIVKIPVYTSPATTGDMYRCFVVPSGVNVSKYITAFEAIPGNRGIVHHVLVYADTTGQCAQLDAQDPGPGYTSFGGVGSNSAIMLGGWVPGTAPLQMPSGFGVRLPANSDIVIQIHYPAGTSGQVDSTEIHFFFSPTNNVRNVYIEPVLNHFTTMENGPLVIPANTTKTFTERYDLPPFINMSLLGVAPHMHLIGRNFTSFGITPTNDTQRYIQINEWDFHWQGFYMFKKIMKVAGGTKVYARAFYDNTTNNPENPNSPPQTVTAGEATTDEMMIEYFIFALYQNGDENIVIDSTISVGVPGLTYYHGQQLLETYPNPASNEVVIKCYLEEKQPGSIDIIGLDGKLVKTFMPLQIMNEGYMAYRFSIAEIPSGVYQVRFRTSEGVKTDRLVIQH
jgi:mono/diheme cytochrome c family protein